MNFRRSVFSYISWLILPLVFLTVDAARVWPQAVTANTAQRMVFAGLRSTAARGQINALQTDAAGDIYLAFDQGDGVRILKVANDGGALLAQVQLGAAGDSAAALALDASGNVYVAGTSTSGSLKATSGAAIGAATSGATNSFVAKFDSNLNQTFLTFTGGTRIAASAVAASGDSVFVTGVCYGSDLPVSATAIEQSPAFGSLQNGFVEAFSADGSMLEYATYITGAQGDTTPTGVAVDAGDDAWLVGSTTASGFPTLGAVVPEILSTPSGFLLQLTPAGDGIVYSTFVPGAGLDSVALDSTGLVLLVSGQVALGQFPVDTVQSPLVPTSYQVLLRWSLDGSLVESGTVIAPALQSVVTAASGGAAWVGGSFTPGAAPLLPQSALSTIGNAFAVRVTPAAGIDQTVRFGGLANFDQTYASVPVGIAGVADDASGALFVGGFAQPTASASLLASETYDFPLRDEPGAAFPSVLADAKLTAADCGGSLCSGSAGFLAKVDPATAASAIAFSADAIPLVTLRNLGSVAAEGLQLTTTAGAFTTTCGSELAPGGACDVLLAGGMAGTLTADTSDGGGGSVAFQSYLPSNPASGLVFEPRELDFGIQTAASAAGTRTITVANLGSAAATFDEAVVATPEAQTPFSEVANDCPSSATAAQRQLAPGATCTITIAFSAFGQSSNDGFIQGQWIVGAGEVALTGYSQAANLSLSATEIDFGTEFQGSPVLPRYLYLSNASVVAQAHANVSVPSTSPFTVTDGCPASLPPNSVCRLQINYLSSAAPSADSLTLALDRGLSVLLTGETMPAQSVSGSTVSPNLSISPTQALFGDAVVVTGVSSATQTFSVTNSGTTSIPLSVAVAGDFSDVTSCGSTLPGGSNCAVAVAFTPSQPGLRQGLLTVSSGAGSAPLTTALSGTGNGILAPNNATLVLGATPAGQPLVNFYKVTQPFESLSLKTTGPYLVTLVEDTGFGYGDPPVSAYAASGSGTCHNCWLGIRFQPTASGEQDGTLSFGSAPGGLPYVLQLTGSGIATSGLILSPSVVAFGTVPVGSVSGETLVNLTNLVSSGSPITVSSVAATGDFTIPSFPAGGNACGGSLAYSATCSVWIQFAPTTTGDRTGTLTVDTSAGTASAGFTGTGTTAQAIALSPLSLTFAAILGQAGQAQAVVVTNASTQTLTIAPPTTSTSSFSAASACGVLAPGAECSIQVSFTPGPASVADVLAIPVISLSSSGSKQTQIFQVALSGSFTSQNQGISVSPGSVAFGPVATSSVGSSRQITVTNLKAEQVTISLTLPRNYELQQNLCASLAPNASCTFSLAFVPLENGDLPGTVAIFAVPSDGSSASTTAVYADGFGVGTGAVSLSGGLIVEGVFNFGIVTNGQSASQQFELTNTSTTQAVTVRRVVSQPPFLSTTTCGTLLMPSAKCTATVQYSPQGAASGSSGNDLGSLTIESDAQSSPEILDLEGQPAPGSGTAGAVPLASFSLSQGSLSFGTTTVGDTSTPQSLLLTNTGTAPIQVTSVSTTQDFLVQSGCALVAAGGTCTITVASTPQQAGIRIAGLEISSNASDALEVVSLTSTSLGSPLVFSPTSLSFGNVLVGTAATLPVQITNSGSNTITFKSITASKDFAVAGNCPPGGGSLAPQATCTEQVTYEPSTPGVENGAVQFATSASTGPLQLPLSGIGVQPELAAAPATLSFGPVALGASATLTFSLTNQGSVPVTGLTFHSSGDYAVASPCSQSTLAGGASCTLQVTFTPTAAGVRNGTLMVVSSDPASPLSISLSGTGASSSGFLLTINGGASASASVTSGDFATFALLLSPTGNFSGTVALTCTPVQRVAYASCSLLPSQVSLGSTAQSAKATINTEESSAGVGAHNLLPHTGVGRTFLALLLPGVLLAFRRGRTLRRWLGQGIACGAILLVLMLSGCGGGGGGSGPAEHDTPPGQYQFQVSASSTSGPPITQTVTLNLTVTPR